MDSNVPFSNVFKEIINLKYSEFVEMIKELNGIAEYFVDEDGCSLSFAISKGTDKTFLWKLTVRIKCSKLKSGESDAQCNRILRLNQFINIYNQIKLQSDALRTFERNDQENQKSSAGTASCMKESRLYDTIKSMSSSEISAKDEEICCICMESKPNLILSCTHNYCEKCIKEWQVTNHTCPICRCVAGENDGFILADKPDYFNLQDEMSKSLFQITDEPEGRKRGSFKRIIHSDDENDSD